MKYKIDKPYPSLDSLEKNIPYGNILLSHLGGLHSKMNTVSLYFYNHIILEKEHPQLSHIMYEMCLVEMQHLHLFSKICFRLGVDPRLWDCQNDLLEYWSPGYNVYPTQLTSLLENVIMQEKRNIASYQKTLSCIHEPLIQDVLEHMILDEKLHLLLLEEYKERNP